MVNIRDTCQGRQDNQLCRVCKALEHVLLHVNEALLSALACVSGGLFKKITYRKRILANCSVIILRSTCRIGDFCPQVATLLFVIEALGVIPAIPGRGDT